MAWKKTTVHTPEGPMDAVAPEIVSASRSTDIPAFYSEWFMNRLAAGYAKWINPFNRKAQYVSFERMKAIVFWSKDPRPMLEHLEVLDRRGLAYYFQFTINDYESDHGSVIERNIPPLLERIRTFKALSTKVGRHRVIWRFDPLLLSQEISIEKLLERIKSIGDDLHEFTDRLVFSFADIARYAKVRNNLRNAGIEWREFTPEQVTSFAHELSRLNAAWGLKLSTCAESIDLGSMGIDHNRCIDDELLLRISDCDPVLRRLFGADADADSHGDLFGYGGTRTSDGGHRKLKDKGQRMECGCIVSKDIGQYDTCPHLCAYCYANTSPKVVMKNRDIVTEQCESILPSCL